MKPLAIALLLAAFCSILVQAHAPTPSAPPALLKPLLPFSGGNADVNKEPTTGVATINPACAGASNELKVKFNNIEVPTSSDAAVFGIANSGTTVGTYRDSNAIYQGFIRSSSGNVTTLDDPQGQNTILRGISPDGNCSRFSARTQQSRLRLPYSRIATAPDGRTFADHASVATISPFHIALLIFQ